jgi:hypothetical protein
MNDWASLAIACIVPRVNQREALDHLYAITVRALLGHGYDVEIRASLPFYVVRGECAACGAVVEIELDDRIEIALADGTITTEGELVNQ